MKPLRTGLAAGLLAGGVGAATKLVEDWRAGTLDRGGRGAKVLVGADKRPASKDGAVNTFIARRAVRRAEANRPAWVVAPAPGPVGTGSGGAVSTSPRPARPAPVAAPRRMPTLESLRPPSAKTVGVSVAKYAVKQAGRTIGKVAADRVGKAIEVIEVLEKVVATASESSASRSAPTPSGPGADRVVPATASIVSVPARPGPPASGSDHVPTTSATESGGEAAAAPAPKPRGTLVSVRKFERGPRVVVGPSVQAAGPPAVVTPPEPEAVPEAVPAAVSEPPAAAAVAPAPEVASSAAAPTVAPSDAPAPDAAPTATKRPAKAKSAPKAKAAPKTKRATAKPASANTKAPVVTENGEAPTTSE